MTNDRQIRQNVVTELENDNSVPTGSVGVEVHHGVVKLAGRVCDAALKRSAELAARRVPGVTRIVLDMGIKQPI